MCAICLDTYIDLGICSIYIYAHIIVYLLYISIVIVSLLCIILYYTSLSIYCKFDQAWVLDVLHVNFCFSPCSVHRFVPGKGKIFVVIPDLMNERSDRLECKFSVVNFQAGFALEEILLQAMAKEPLKLQAASVTKI